MNLKYPKTSLICSNGGNKIIFTGGYKLKKDFWKESGGYNSACTYDCCCRLFVNYTGKQ